MTRAGRSDRGDPALLPAHELARGIRRRAWSSVELLDHFAARVERLDGRINAMPVRDLDRARDAARAADERLAARQVDGPLHGVLMSVKESFNVAGLSTTYGF